MRDEFCYFTSLLDFQEKRIDRNMHLWKSIYLCLFTPFLLGTLLRENSIGPGEKEGFLQSKCA